MTTVHNPKAVIVHNSGEIRHLVCDACRDKQNVPRTNYQNA